jgi:activating signal cointegrator 1
MTSYPVLSLSPPYGTLITLLLKTIETRGWATAHRGLLLIHQTAAPGPKGTTEAALWELCLSEPFRSALASKGVMSPSQLPRGKIVALVEVVDCLPTAGVRVNGGGPKYADWVHELSDQERAFGDYSPGRYGWILDKVRPLPEPIAARGMPGLWRWEGDIGL